MVIDMRNQKQHEKWLAVARNRWYNLSLALSEAGTYIMIKDLCEMAGIPNDKALRDYFDKWGDMMVEKYGKLPYVKLNSSRYDRYMEMK